MGIYRGLQSNINSPLQPRPSPVLVNCVLGNDIISQTYNEERIDNRITGKIENIAILGEPVNRIFIQFLL